MYKSLMSLAAVLAVAGLLQGCATTPGAYSEQIYQPPPGYILVPVPRSSYGGYYQRYYGAYYRWNPRFYGRPYPPTIWYWSDSSHREKPKPGQPCTHCNDDDMKSKPAPGSGPRQPFIPRGKPICDPSRLGSLPAEIRRRCPPPARVLIPPPRHQAPDRMVPRSSPVHPMPSPRPKPASPPVRVAPHKTLPSEELKRRLPPWKRDILSDPPPVE